MRGELRHVLLTRPQLRAAVEGTTWDTGASRMIDDPALIRRAQAGDVAAFEQLVHRHVAMTYRVALQIVRNVEDAQDVSQLALMSAWRGLPSFRQDAAFSSWLHQIVRRHALNCVQRGARSTCELRDSELHELSDSHRGPADLAVLGEAAAGLQRAVAALPDLQCRAVRLRHFEGRSYEEISIVTGTSISAVRSHLYRARRSLAVALADAR